MLSFRILTLALLAALFSGCATMYSLEKEKRYHLVRVTDVEGKLVAEWIAEGYVKKTQRGYMFKAVERFSGPPGMQEIHYPYGRPMDIAGPNIVVSRVGKPLWLYQIESQGTRE